MHEARESVQGVGLEESRSFKENGSEPTTFSPFDVSECNMPTTIPLTVSPEAAARVAELGMQKEFDRMLEHTRQTVPGLQAISVNLAYDPCGSDDPRVVIDVIMADPHLEDDPTGRQWGRWFVTTFPPDVCRHFVMLAGYGDADAR